MTRTTGVIGYAESRLVRPGVSEDVIVEYKYRGDVLRNSAGPQEGDKILDDLKVGNSISIVASPFHRKNFTRLKYISWLGELWKVSNVDVALPRLILRLGGLYNGPTAEAPVDSGGDTG